MPSTGVLVDAGALIALLNRNDPDHRAVVEFFGSHFGILVTTWPVLAEATHLVGDKRTSLMAYVNQSRWRILGMDGAGPRVRELMERYADQPMDLADASLVWAAETTGITRVLTTDRADFSVYRTRTGHALEVLP